MIGLAANFALVKKQSKVDYANYRPITLLSNIQKIIEKLMYKRLFNFLDINNLIYSLQFGIRQKHLTAHPQINLTESIRETLEEGSFGYGIFVDLQKGFDRHLKALIIKSYCKNSNIVESVMCVMTGLNLSCQIGNNSFPLTIMEMI